jgi:hypothetical protein
MSEVLELLLGIESLLRKVVCDQVHQVSAADGRGINRQTNEAVHAVCDSFFNISNTLHTLPKITKIYNLVSHDSEDFIMTLHQQVKQRKDGLQQLNESRTV